MQALELFQLVEHEVAHDLAHVLDGQAAVFGHTRVGVPHQTVEFEVEMRRAVARHGRIRCTQGNLKIRYRPPGAGRVGGCAMGHGGKGSPPVIDGAAAVEVGLAHRRGTPRRVRRARGTVQAAPPCWTTVLDHPGTPGGFISDDAGKSAGWEKRGWGTWIRTRVARSRAGCSTAKLSPSRGNNLKPRVAARLILT